MESKLPAAESEPKITENEPKSHVVEIIWTPDGFEITPGVIRPRGNDFVYYIAPVDKDVVLCFQRPFLFGRHRFFVPANQAICLRVLPFVPKDRVQYIATSEDDGSPCYTAHLIETEDPLYGVDVVTREEAENAPNREFPSVEDAIPRKVAEGDPRRPPY